MPALALSDIHSSLGTAEKAKKTALEKKAEIIILLGDLTNMGGTAEAAAVLNVLKPLPVIGFAGNFEYPEVQREIEKRGFSLHAAKKKIGKWTFVGFGGGLWDNPGAWLFSEEEIKKTLAALLQGEKNVILLTHLPPKNTTLDLAHNGEHIGSAAVREAIKKFRPALHLCGHCHEAAGEEKVGGTTSINIGAAKEGKALLLSAGQKLGWKKILL